MQPGVPMQCLTPSASRKAFSNRSGMSEVRPLAATSKRYFSVFGPISRGKMLGSLPGMARYDLGPKSACFLCAAMKRTAGPSASRPAVLTYSTVPRGWQPLC